jgi:Glyoxalase-like domain
LAQQTALGKLQCVVLDCSDVLELAGFYQALLGGSINQADPRWAVSEDFSTLHISAGLVVAFQRVLDYRPPRWPGSAHPQQFHLDIEIPDLGEARQKVVELGATVLAVDPRGWTVCADPAGHPFCLLQR